MDSPRTVMHNSVVYHKNMPMDMKEKNTISKSNPNDGAFQMSKGRMGELANLISHIANAAIWSRDTTSRA